MNTELMASFAATVEEELLALHERLEAGQITVEDFILLATAVLVAAKARGVALADLGAATELSVLREVPVPAVGLPVPSDAERTARSAVEDLLASATYAAGAAAAVAVLGRSEALSTVQVAYGEALVEHGADGWTRVLNDGACELCHDLAGDVLPADAPMYHHKGCGCSQKPVDTE